MCAQDLISAHPNSRHPGLPSTQLEPTMKPMGAKYSGCIQAHFWFYDYLSTSEAEPKWSKRRTSPRHSTQHYQDIIIDGGGDQGCGENEGRDVGGQASSDWGCCLPTFSLLLHIIAWHPLVLHGIADTACDRGCAHCSLKSQLPILGRSKTLR